MNNLLSLPMYDIHRSDTEALWAALVPLLAAEGLAANRQNILWPQTDLLAHWQNENLLLSQTCGYPLMTLLPDVQVVGAFHYDVPGCEFHHYRSFLVVREEDTGKDLEDFHGRRGVCNSADSQSGYHSLKKMLAPVMPLEKFFSTISFSGSHRQSLLAVKQVRADIAAIDCVTWALLARHQASLLNGLTIVGQTDSVPGLPLITSAKTSPEQMSALRRGLKALVAGTHTKRYCEALLIGDFQTASREDYAAMISQAIPERLSGNNGAGDLANHGRGSDIP